MIDPTETAVLMIVFNRPDQTRQVFERIREARPKRLYIAADGPRANRPDDVDTTAATREIAQAVDWPCEVKTLFRDQMRRNHLVASRRASKSSPLFRAATTRAAT